MNLQEHSLLVNRLAILTNKLAVESKIRDAAVSISRLYTSKRLSRQADDQLDSANRKVESVVNELNKIAKREAEVRTRILRHMAAVLGLMLRRMENPVYGGPVSSSVPPRSPTPLPNGTDRDLLSPSSVASPTFSSLSSAIRTAVTAKFEGPHLFAGNKDAIIPHPRSPFASPQLPGPQAGFPSLSPGYVAPSAVLSNSTTTLPYMISSNVDTQVQQLTEQLANSKAELKQHMDIIDSLQGEREDLQNKLQMMDTSNTRMQRQINADQQTRETQAQHELQSLQGEITQARKDLDRHVKVSGDWEKQIRQQEEDFRAEKQSLLRSLRSTIQRHQSSDSPLSPYLPDPSQDLDVPSFLSIHLGTLLSEAGQAHTQALHQNEQLQEQIKTFQQISSDQSSQSSNELKQSKRQIEHLQKEKQDWAASLSQMGREKANLDRALQEVEQQLENHRNLSLVQQKESEKQSSQRLAEAEQLSSRRTHEWEQERKALYSRTEALQDELQEDRQDRATVGRALQQIWQDLPGEQALRARLALNESDDLARYKAAFLSTTSRPATGDRTSFSVERLAQGLEAVLASDQRLVSRLASQEDSAMAHKASAERAQKILQENNGKLQSYTVQVRQLEERIEVSGQKEVQMLERLNDLQIALEQSRSATKRSEGRVSEVEQRCSLLEKEKLSQQTKPDDRQRMQRQIDELKEELTVVCSATQAFFSIIEIASSQAQDELDELRNKESRQRVQLLDELSSLTEEASSLRTQLRAAQRRAAASNK